LLAEKLPLKTIPKRERETAEVEDIPITQLARVNLNEETLIVNVQVNNEVSKS
jgi:hypothetical protein